MNKNSTYKWHFIVFQLFMLAFCCINQGLFAQSYTISTIAGTGTSGFSGDGGLATSANLKEPNGLALDATGNIYFVDGGNYRIRKITTSTGNISTIAGNGTSTYAGDGSVATSASFSYPTSVAVDGSGNIFITDLSDYRIRKVTFSTGFISTVVGDGNFGYAGDGGLATSARLNDVQDIVVDASGNIYFSDNGNLAIRKVNASNNIINTIAGGNVIGAYTGDGGLATLAELKFPYEVALDASGNIYFSDGGNHVIRKITVSTGIITTIAGTGTEGFSGDGGQATAAKLSTARGVAVDLSGNVYIADNGNNRIRKITASTGIITTIAGTGNAVFNGDGSATSANLNSPGSIAVDASGNLYISEYSNNRIRKLTPNLPNMEVRKGLTPINSGTGSYDFTFVNVGSSSSETFFDILNMGSANLNLTGTPKVNITGANAGDFIVSSNPSSTVAPSQLTTFSLRFIPTDGGTRTATVSIANDDPTKNPYTFTVTGSGQKQNQTITFSLGANATKNVGDAPFALTGTSTSGLTVSYSSSNTAVATISGSTVTIVGVGSSVITATQAGNTAYFPALDITGTLTVNPAVIKSNQTITFSLGSNATKTVGDSPFALVAASTSGLTVSYSSSNPAVATISGGTVTIVGAGTSVITASQSGNGLYNAAANVTATLTVNPAVVKSNQTITFSLGANATKNVGDSPFSLTGTSTSGLTVSYSSSNPAVATVSGGTVTIVGAGTSVITASQSGNASYNAAANVAQTLTVNKGSQTITFSLGTNASKNVGDAPFVLSGTSTSGLAVSYSSSNTAVATVSGGTVTIVGAGTAVITASQSGNASYNAAADVAQTLTVSPVGTVKTNQTITFSLGTNASKNVGDAPFVLSGTSTSGLAVSYSSSNLAVATVSGSTVTIVGVGSSVITASQSGNTSYNAATDVSQTLTISAIVTALEDLSNTDILLYPNPSQDVLQIKVGNTRGGTAQIIDAYGQLISSTAFDKDGELFVIPVANLPAGVYTLQLVVDGDKISKKFIKQ